MDRKELEERTKNFSINVIQLVATLQKNKATDVIRTYLKNVIVIPNLFRNLYCIIQ